MIVTIIRYNNKKQTSVVPTRVMQICVILKFALRPFTSTIGKEKSLIPFLISLKREPIQDKHIRRFPSGLDRGDV